MSVKRLTKHHLGFLSLNGGCTGSSESKLVKCHIVGNHMSRLILYMYITILVVLLGRCFNLDYTTTSTDI